MECAVQGEQVLFLESFVSILNVDQMLSWIES